MKMIRNISQHDGSGTKNQFIEFIGDIADAVQRADSPNFVVECVGILGNLKIPDLDFALKIAPKKTKNNYLHLTGEMDCKGLSKKSVFFANK